MSHVDIFDKTGKKTAKADLDAAIFGVKTNKTLLQQALIGQQSNARQSNAHTKTRGNVAGGGRKPWRQKGTGRARAGSSRSPIWIGGGIVFGPSNERNYTQMLNKKMRRQALLMALSMKKTAEQLIIIDSFDQKDAKTKTMADFLTKLPTKDGSVLIVLPQTDPKVEVSSSNIPYVKTIHLSSLNILDILTFDYLLTTKSGLAAIESQFSPKSDKTDKPAESATKTESVATKPKPKPKSKES